MRRKKNAHAIAHLSKAIEFVAAQLNLLRWQMSRDTSTVQIPEVNQVPKNEAQFTGAIVEFMEVIYGISELGKFNDGNIFIKDLTESLCEKFGFEVKDCYGAYTEMRKRVGKSRTSFLDRLAKALNDKMDRDDEKGLERKRK